MKNESITERRRVVYSALARHLKHDRLLEALWLWEQKYALTNSLELRKFVAEIVFESDSPELKSRIYKTLTRATYFPGEIDLLPDPYDAMHHYRQQCNGTFKYISPFDNQLTTPFSTIVFQRMLETLLNQIKRENSVAHEKLLRSLRSEILGKDLEANRILELTNWLQKKTDAMQLIYPESFMSSFINEIYIFCCNEFGPIKSDKMLANTIEDANGLEEAK
ncbi:hypothetical protein, partial [Kaarinaea lacus]